MPRETTRFEQLDVSETSRFTDDEINVVYRYTEDMSEPVNIFLGNEMEMTQKLSRYGHSSEELSNFIKQLDKIIEQKGNTVSEAGLTVFKGVNSERNVSLYYPRYMSTTIDHDVVTNFYDAEKGCCIFNISVTPGVKYLDLSKNNMSRNPQEKEILLERGLQLKSVLKSQNPYFDKKNKKFIDVYDITVGKPLDVVPIFGSRQVKDHLNNYVESIDNIKSSKIGGSNKNKNKKKQLKKSNNKKRSRSKKNLVKK